MSGIRAQHRLISNTIRNFHRSAICWENKTQDTVTKKVEKPTVLSEIPTMGPRLYRVKSYDKYLLVWQKKYKSIDEVPSHVPEEIMSHVHSKTRIRVANILMVITVFGCFWAVWSGKKAASEGDSIQKRMLDNQQRVREEYLLSLQKEKKNT